MAMNQAKLAIYSVRWMGEKKSDFTLRKRCGPRAQGIPYLNSQNTFFLSLYRVVSCRTRHQALPPYFDSVLLGYLNYQTAGVFLVVRDH